jgi:hypothetical protein
MSLQELIHKLINTSEIYDFYTNDYQLISFNIYGVLCFNRCGLWHPKNEQINRYKRVELHDIIRKITISGIEPLIKTWSSFSIFNYKFLDYLDSIEMLEKITFLVYTDSTVCIPMKYITKMTNLKTLIINTEKIRLYDRPTIEQINTYAEELAKITSFLPATLETLYIHCIEFNGNLDNLPHGLRILYIISALFNQSLDFLPQNLEALILLHAHNYHFSINNLPPMLKLLALDINKIVSDYKIIYQLPITLQLPLSIEYLYLQFPKSFIDITDNLDCYHLKHLKTLICNPKWFQIISNQSSIKLINIDTVHYSKIIEKLFQLSD